MPETLHVAGIWPNRLARAMSVIDFALPFGGTIALAMMGAVFNNKLAWRLPSGEEIHINNNQGSLQAISSLPPSIQQAFRDRARQAVVYAFAAVTPIVGLAIFASLLLGNVRITKAQQKSNTGHLETRDAVETRPYLWALMMVNDPEYIAHLAGRLIT